MNLSFSIIVAGTITFLLIVIGFIFTRLYKRATKETSFVRTGFGGEKVIMNGGAIILPVLHDIVHVNMKTLKLTVVREENDSLITKDRMRIDIMADFYVRVKPDKDSISNAAQTLGSKTMNPSELKDLIEAKFVDALRSVAASMDMESLHEKRTDFVQQVQNTVAGDLLKNGLELEAVSLTNLDQTPAEFFDPNNAFDAEGLTVLTRKTEERKKIRNDIERETELAIQNKDLETKKQSLELSKEEAEAKARQEAEIAQEQAAREKEAEEAKISATKEIEKAQISKERELEAARIQKEKAIQEAEIEKEKQLKEAQIAKEIEISQKSEEEYQARAKANEAKAQEAAAAEKILTAKQMEEAERQKQLALIAANKEAEEKAIEKKVAAHAEKEAAQDKADAMKLQAEGEAESIRITAEAKEKEYEIEADGKRKLNEAENVLSSDIIEMRIKEALISNLPKIVEQVVAPMKNIDSIKIVEMGGVEGSNGVVTGEASNSLPDQIVNSALKYKTQMPVLNDLMQEVGLNLDSVQGMTAPIATSKVEAPKEIEKSNTQDSVKDSPLD